MEHADDWRGSYWHAVEAVARHVVIERFARLVAYGCIARREARIERGLLTGRVEIAWRAAWPGPVIRGRR